MTSTPFWPRPAERYAGELPERVDALVIGGGIAGVSLLHHLHARGIDGVLVERAHIAAGASGRNAGFLLAGVADNYAEAVRTYGRARTREIWQMTLENHATMTEAVKGQAVGYRRLGSATLASGEKEAAQLEESAQMLKDDGFQAGWDGRRLVNPHDGEVDPTAMVGALARMAPSGAIREGVNVTAIEAGASEVFVHAGAASECRAGCVILATNAYTPQLLPEVPIKPRRAQMLASTPDADRLCDLPTYSHFGYRYWRQLPTGEVLIGGWRDTAYDEEVGYDERPTERIQSHLDEQLKRMGGEGGVTNRWAGTMGFTESGLPLAGPLDGMPNVYLCAGFNGHGMGFAFITAKQVVASI
ncbi:MAG TPA: FAD-binding oxidoreductase [Candidatus Dormibacteraeota bacterium]|nr:FAD-binding oxidoreductase [Candidatus Dormibacteraeota bacterium]